jgi:hypothetical protein
MDGSDKQADAESPARWPEFEAVLQDLEDHLSAEAVGGDPTAPWEGIADQAVVTLSGALLKTLCDIAAQAAGAMEWEPEGILLHSGMSTPVPLRFHIRPARA